MKRTIILILFLAALLAVLLFPTITVNAGLPAEGAQPAQAAMPVAQQSPAVQVIIGLVVALFACLAMAPMALGERKV